MRRCSPIPEGRFPKPTSTSPPLRNTLARHDVPLTICVEAWPLPLRNILGATCLPVSDLAMVD